MKQPSLPIAGRTQAGVILAIHAVLTCASLLMLLHYLNAVDPNQVSLTWRSTFLTLLCAWMVWSWWRVARGLFNPYGLFLLAAIAFNAGQVVMASLHLLPTQLLEGRISEESVLGAVVLVTVGLAALHLGALLAALRPARTRPTAPELDAQASTRARLVGSAFLLIAAVPALLQVKADLTAAYTLGYAHLYQREAGHGLDTASSVLAGFLLPGAFYLLAGSRHHRAGRVVASIAVVAATAANAFVGYRARAFLPLLAYAWLYHRTIKPLPRRLPTVAGVLLLALFPLIGSVRSITGDERVSLRLMVDTYRSIGNPLVRATADMGATMLTIAHTIQLIPGTEPYDGGARYLWALRSPIPNFLWGSWQPEYASGAQWLIWTVDPVAAAHGQGLGFSFIAEAYASFGWVGAVIFLAVIGFALARCYYLIQQRAQPLATAAAAVFLVSVLQYARAESIDLVRPFVWYAFLPYFTLLRPRRHRFAPGRGAFATRCLVTRLAPRWEPQQ